MLPYNQQNQDTKEKKNMEASSNYEEVIILTSNYWLFVVRNLELIICWLTRINASKAIHLIHFFRCNKTPKKRSSDRPVRQWFTGERAEENEGAKLLRLLFHVD